MMSIERDEEEADETNVQGVEGAGSAAVWTLVAFGGTQVVRLAANIVLARLLLPEIFGLMYLVETFLLGMYLLSDIGSRLVIIQSRREDRSFLDAIWTAQVLRGVGLAGAMGLASGPIASFYENPYLAIILPISGLAAMIVGFESTALDVAYRRLEARKVQLLDLAAHLVATSVTLAWAWAFPTIWALVGGHLLFCLLRMWVSHFAFAGPANRLHWDFSALKELATFGRWILLSTGVMFLANYTGGLMLGKFLTERELGVFKFAWGLTLIPVNAIGQLAQFVIFPVLSHQARVGPAEFERAFRQARDLVLSASRVAVLGLALFAPAFFGYLYPPAFQGAAAMTRLLSVYLWFTLLQAASDRAILASGDSRSLMLANLAKFLMTVAACLLGFRLAGTTGFLLGMAVGAAAGYLAVGYFLRRKLGLVVVVQDLTATLRLAALVLAGWTLGDLIAPSWGLSSRFSSLLTTLIFVPAPALRTVREVMAARKSRPNDAS